MALELMRDQLEVTPLTDVLARPQDLLEVESFRIAAYNMRNLFGSAPDVHAARPGPPASGEQLKALAQVIRELDADVLALEEVQNEKVLKELFQKRVNPKLEKSLRYTSFVCVPSRDPRGINVAIVTRFAINGNLTFHDREFGSGDKAVRFSRDLLGAEIYATPTYRYLHFVTHLKSKMGGESSAKKRLEEAKEIRVLLEKPQFGGNPFIAQDMVLCGDMNDDPGTSPIETLKGTGAMELSDVLAGLDPSWTYPTHTKYAKTRLDYILASQSLLLEAPTVHRDIKAAKTASDHYPVSATIRVRR